MIDSIGSVLTYGLIPGEPFLTFLIVSTGVLGAIVVPLTLAMLVKEYGASGVLGMPFALASLALKAILFCSPYYRKSLAKKREEEERKKYAIAEKEYEEKMEMRLQKMIEERCI